MVATKQTFSFSRASWMHDVKSDGSNNIFLLFSKVSIPHGFDRFGIFRAFFVNVPCISHSTFLQNLNPGIHFSFPSLLSHRHLGFSLSNSLVTDLQSDSAKRVVYQQLNIVLMAGGWDIFFPLLYPYFDLFDFETRPPPPSCFFLPKISSQKFIPGTHLPPTFLVSNAQVYK